MADFQKIEPTKEDVQRYANSAARLVGSRARRDLVMLLAAVMVENHCLTAECNQHRTARGLELLPTYAPPR